MIIGRYIILIGLLMIVVGALLPYLERLPFLSWMGRLPGDIRVEGGRTRFYFPIATCLVVSLALSVLLRLLRMVLPRL